MTEIELTDTQRQALQAEQGRPIDVVDPATRQHYVLLDREHYERVRALLGPPAPELPPRIAPLLLRSMQAYWQELPELLTSRSSKQGWVGYRGEERVCFGRTDLDVYQECFRRGFQRGEFYVGKVAADPENIPPWGTPAGEWSFYEVAAEAEGTGPSSGV